MRVNVAEPTTSNAPTAWRTARWKLRSCGNTGRQSERRARKRTSNTVRGSGSTCTKALPRLIRYQIKMSKLQRNAWHSPPALLTQGTTSATQLIGFEGQSQI